MIWSPFGVAVVISTFAGTQPEICRSLCRSMSTSTTPSTCAHDLPAMVVRSITRMTLRPRVARASCCPLESGETYILTSLMTVPCSFSCACAQPALSASKNASTLHFIFLTMLISLDCLTVHRDFLFQLVNQVCGARLPVALRVLARNLLRQRQGLLARGFALGGLVLDPVNIGQRGLPPRGIVERFRGLGGLRMLARVLLKQGRFFLRTLGHAAPLRAKLCFQQIVGGQLRLLRLRKSCHDFFQISFFQLRA